MTRSGRSAGAPWAAPSAEPAPTVAVGSPAFRHPRGRTAAVVVFALAAMVGLLVARPSGALAAGSAPPPPVVEVVSAVSTSVVAPTRIELPRPVPWSVPKVRPGHDTTHQVRSVPLPPGWLPEAVGLALLALVGLISLVDPVQPAVRAQAAARGRGPPRRR